MQDSWIEIYDTTLRDGAQGEGLAYSVDDKFKIADCLDDLGVTYIEGGWPGANPKDIEFFERAKSLNLKHAKLVAFGSTCRANRPAAEDSIVQAYPQWSAMSHAQQTGALRVKIENDLSANGARAIWLAMGASRRR